ncbi:Cytochrome b5 [Armadillidium nasatum]|uniref:Cytochrome b5 n=1 Tax=Armadillidium nasatum TaxID=96803 RepID=A0A5N5TFQ5_9CRUS|nr:Cytochrome b5 [Armadillidium nasatum]
MKNYLGRMPFIFSLQHEEVLELPEESLNDLNTKLAELSCDMPLSLPLPQEDEEDQEKEVDKGNKSTYLLNGRSLLYMMLHPFLQEHPGGEDVLLEYAGRDATISFRSVGHSGAALKAMEKYVIGILPDRQRLFPSDSQSRWSIV